MLYNKDIRQYARKVEPIRTFRRTVLSNIVTGCFYGGFPIDIRPENIKLKIVSANINSNRVSVKIKMKRVSENMN